jgi:predicted oxidoreductase
MKWVTEDSGVCLLDEMNRRILIEGCEYRYVFCANEVKRVEPLSGYALSGARLICRVAGKDMNLVLKAAGQGHLPRLVRAFAPRVGATGLATELNKTLFGIQSDTFAQAASPPPLPKP